ncbi:undecaprenyl-diphosphatase [Bacillus sp. AGMB 02131]|uniref:Undecaprenyl-diphosphatase n=1 Tax=Peribacillus faecalis TaxID=2772559 RepID=A0A927HBE8_9BACI|nr:undecaprenyl-diphosphatase [Peribacillus faecalis]MBD3108517.1 undecaprenyl-diphosphatase [Peribacillus faecalis]
MMETNAQIFKAINNLGKEYTFLNPFFIFIADYTLYILIAALLLYWFTRSKKNRMMVISSLLSVVIAEVGGKIIGLLHFNYQPFVSLSGVNQLIEKDIGNSFPSDHTIIFFTVCFTFFFFKKKYKHLWIVLALLVGLSRIWVGVHYPADVLMGAVTGIGAAYLCYRLVPKNRKIRKIVAKAVALQVYK